MIYNGAYKNDVIYGTSRNNKVIATTNDDATFLRLILSVDLAGFSWSHTFEIPFFQNTAEFIFENYVHSIITQNFNKPEVSATEIQVHSFPMANVSFEIKEMQGATELASLSRSFYMILGDYQDVPMISLDTRTYLLPTKKTKYVTNKAILSYTIITKENTVDIYVNGTTSSIAIPSLFLNTITIPVILSELPTITVHFSFLTLSAKYDHTQIIPSGNDHHLLFFQNLYGTISIMEFTGNLIIQDQVKSKDYRFVKQEITTLSTSDIEVKEDFTLNTGNIFDFGKYEKLMALVKSFNIYFGTDFKKVIMNRSHRFKPYQSRVHNNNETIKFKIAENADIHYRQF